MNRLMLFAAGAALALVPAAVGLTGNSSFAEGVATLRLTRAIDLAAASGKPQRV